jgi:chemotaxis protein CheZ
MDKSLLDELKELLQLIESFKSEISKVSAQKDGFKAVNHHIETAINESEEATKKLIDLIGDSLEKLQESLELTQKLTGEEAQKLQSLISATLNNLMSALTLLEFQDILAQRLLKVKTFISDVEKSILKIALLAGLEEKPQEEKNEIKKKIEELEWKKEVSQEDVDEIMKQFGL